VVEHGLAHRAVDEAELVDAAVVVHREADAEVIGDVVGGEAESRPEDADGGVGNPVPGEMLRARASTEAGL
jgi:hypothetical protein